MNKRYCSGWLVGLTLGVVMTFSRGLQGATVSVSADLEGQASDVVTAIVTVTGIDDLGGPVTVEAVDLTMRYDPSAVSFEGGRPGVLFRNPAGNVLPNVLVFINDTGTRVTAGIANPTGVTLIEGGVLFEVDFRIRYGAPTGETKLDLERLAINETQVVFDLAGADDSDGVIRISLSPAVTLIPIIQLLLLDE